MYVSELKITPIYKGTGTKYVKEWEQQRLKTTPIYKANASLGTAAKRPAVLFYPDIHLLNKKYKQKIKNE